MDEKRTAGELARTMLRGGHQLWRDLRFTVTNIGQTPTTTFSQMNYDEYWRVRGQHSFQPRYRIMAQLIDPGSSVLDIGCGDGWLLEYLSRTRNIQGFGIDISAEAVHIAQSRGVLAQVADTLTWQPDREYDYIILSEILEHLPDPEAVIGRIRGCFRQVIIASIPNIGYYPHRLRLLFGRFPVQWSLHPAEHLRFWTVTDFRNWVRSLDLEVAGIYSSNGFLLLHKYWPNLLGNQVVFVIRKPGLVSAATKPKESG